MLSRFFHLRSSLKPFAAPSVRPTVQAPDSPPAAQVPAGCHADYDRRPLETRGFDHYVEWHDDDERFFVR